jgi:hypothetical protein
MMGWQRRRKAWMAGRAWTSEFGGCLFVLQTCYNRGCVQ